MTVALFKERNLFQAIKENVLSYGYGFLSCEQKQLQQQQRQQEKQNLYNWYRTGFLNDSKSERLLWYTFKSAQVICFQLFVLPPPNGGKGSFTYVWAFSKTYTYT